MKGVTASLWAWVGPLDALDTQTVLYGYAVSLSHWDPTEPLGRGENRNGDNGEEDNKDDDNNGSSCTLSPHICQALC